MFAAMTDAITSGFGPRSDGEDAFDSTIGLLGLLRVLRRELPQDPHIPAWLLSIEGWILGQASGMNYF